MKTYPRVLTIAGSDSGGGAGIQADIKSISATGSYAASAITAVTVQNTLGVEAVHPVPVDVISAQIDCVLSDIGADAIKIGMLHSAEVVLAVRDALLRNRARNIVLDPVMVATSGHRLIEESAIRVLASELMPLARVITPNIPEAEILIGRQIKHQSELSEAARELSRKASSGGLSGSRASVSADSPETADSSGSVIAGSRASVIADSPEAADLSGSVIAGSRSSVRADSPEAADLSGSVIAGLTGNPSDAPTANPSAVRVSVLMKAGHLTDDRLVDIFYNAEEDRIVELPSARIHTQNTHGTGCTLSSAFASYLAQGYALDDAARAATEYIHAAILSGAEYQIGHGHGPVNHFWRRS